MAPLTFQNRPMVLAPAYKKHNMPSLNSERCHTDTRIDRYLTTDRFTGPSSYYPADNLAITPPPTPSRTAMNGMSQQASTPYHQHQQQMSGSHPIYSPMFFPMQANVSAFDVSRSLLLSSYSDAIRSNVGCVHHLSWPHAGTSSRESFSSTIGSIELPISL